MRGFITQAGYWGYMPSGRYYLFATESDYVEAYEAAVE